MTYPADQTTQPTDPLEPWPDSVTWRPVSPDLVWVELIRLAAFMAVVFAGLGVLWGVTGQVWWGVALVVVAALTGWRVFAIVRAVRAWGYAERDNDLLVRHGLLVRRLSIVPYARMQFVDVSAGPLERAFDLATVQLHTAAAASDAKVPGLRPAEASRLRGSVVTWSRVTALPPGPRPARSAGRAAGTPRPEPARVSARHWPPRRCAVARWPA